MEETVITGQVQETVLKGSTTSGNGRGGRGSKVRHLEKGY